MIPSPHKRIRNVLHSLCHLHKAGYGKIRFMIFSANGGYSIRVGPKRVFALHDGLFIPEDVRHRSLLLPEATGAIDTSALLPQLRYAVLGANHEDRSLDDGLRGADPDYTGWVTRLTSFLDDFDLALPIRDESEYAFHTSPPLRIDFLERLNARPLAPTIQFELPPEGFLRVTPTPCNSELGFAHERETSAPNLLWNVRSGEARDQVVDRLYEEKKMGGGNA